MNVYLEGATTSSGYEYHATLSDTIIRFARADTLDRFVEMARLDRQIGASQHAQLHLAVVDQRQTDGVLPAAHKSLGAIDRIQRPVLTVRSTFVAASINGGQQLSGPR